MKFGSVAWALAPLFLASVAVSAFGQAQVSTRIVTAELFPTSAERYKLPFPLEPTRRVNLLATSDGLLRSLAVPLGANVREGQEIAQLDRAEAQARLKIADAELKERQAELDEAKKGNGKVAIAEARVDAARGRADLARLALEACTVRAPFSGKIMSIPASPGQVLLKGALIAELADTTSLRVLVPVDRRAVSLGSAIKVTVEGQSVNGKIDAILPLPENYSVLRELATQFAAAWVSIPNSKFDHEPGERVSSPYLPDQPLVNVPTRSVLDSEEDEATKVVQVVRGEYVVNVPVKVLGVVAEEWTQVSGAFKVRDVLIVSSSAPLAGGSFIRLGGDNAANAEPADPNQPGAVASVTAPAGAGSRVAPIGAAGRAKSATKSSSAKKTTKPAAGGAPKSAVPF